MKKVLVSLLLTLGITGLADALAMLGLPYGSPRSLHLTRQIMSAVRDTAYRTSVEIAREKNVFPEFDKIKDADFAPAFDAGLRVSSVTNAGAYVLTPDESGSEEGS